MFRWFAKLFNRDSEVLLKTKSGSLKTPDKYINEEEQLEIMRKVLIDHPDFSATMKMMIDDFEKRKEKKDNRGSASSPVSSP